MTQQRLPLDGPNELPDGQPRRWEADRQIVEPRAALMHRVTTISAGTLDALPHNGTVLTVLQVSRLSHRESYFDMVTTVVVSTIVASAVVIVLGSLFGTF